MAASPIPNVKSRNLVPSGVRRIDRHRDMLEAKENAGALRRLRSGCFTRVPHPIDRLAGYEVVYQIRPRIIQTLNVPLDALAPSPTEVLRGRLLSILWEGFAVMSIERTVEMLEFQNGSSTFF